MKLSITFLFAVLTAAQCLAQTFSSLAIFVYEDETDKPIAGASIIIKEAGWASKTTGNDGRAFFDKSMPIGEIHYIVSKEGYQGVEGTFNITTEEKSNSLKIKLSKFRDDRLLITGEVVDENDKDLEGAIVEVKVADIVRTAKTDASGNYKIELILNKTQYDVNTLKLEAKCSNGTGKKSETIDLTRRNVIYKDFKITCGKIPPPPTVATTFEKDNYFIELMECKQSGTQIICSLRITHRESDANFLINGYTNPPSKIIASNGYDYFLSDVRIGNVVGSGSAEKALVRNLPVNSTIRFKDVFEKIDLISKMEITCSGSDIGYFILEFRDVTIKR